MRRNRWYFERTPTSPPDDEPVKHCECGQRLRRPIEEYRGECDKCHAANDESERWIERRTA